MATLSSTGSIMITVRDLSIA